MSPSEEDFTQGLCTFLSAFRHPLAFYYGRDGKEAQIRHVVMIAPNRLRATLTDGEVRTITVD